MGGRLSRWEVWVCLLLVTALSLGVGLYGRFVYLRVNWDGLAAVAHAYDVFHAEPSANLAMIGFVQPPLPALLQLPVVLIAPILATTGLAATLQGAIAAGTAAALAVKSGVTPRELDVGRVRKTLIRQGCAFAAIVP